MEQLKLLGNGDRDNSNLEGSRILVCGGRKYGSRDYVFEVLDDLAPSHLVVGDATGADALAWEWAKSRGVPWTRYEADWNVFGYAAGPKRNQRMLDEGKPDLVVAFPGGKGTADMVRRAKRRGLEVLTLG